MGSSSACLSVTVLACHCCKVPGVAEKQMLLPFNDYWGHKWEPQCPISQFCMMRICTKTRLRLPLPMVHWGTEFFEIHCFFFLLVFRNVTLLKKWQSRQTHWSPASIIALASEEKLGFYHCHFSSSTHKIITSVPKIKENIFETVTAQYNCLSQVPKVGVVKTNNSNKEHLKTKTKHISLFLGQ